MEGFSASSATSREVDELELVEHVYTQMYMESLS